MSSVLQAPSRKTRDATIDFARVVAALFVIYVHSSLAWSSTPDTPVWLSANLTYAVGQVSVPLFLMISGMLIVGRPIGDYGRYLTKRAGATLRPYVSGTIVFLTEEKIRGEGFPPSVHAAVQNFIQGLSSYHLYFLFVLLGMYLIAPLLQGIASAPRSTVIGTMAILFGLAAVGRLLTPFGFALGYLSLGTCFNFLPYFLSGYVLQHVARPARRWHVPLFVFPVAAQMAASRFLAPELGDTFQQYDAPTVMLASIGAFCLLMRIRLSNARVVSIVSSTADLTLGIYVLHPAVLLGVIAWLGPLTAPVWQVMLFPPLCFVITAGIIRALHFVPGLKGWI